MKALIIEDEKAAVRNLMALLGEVDPDIEVIDVLDSITDSVEWFQSHPMPEPENSPGKLKVAFFLWFYSDYYIFELDEHYQSVVVGSSSDKYLWILSRDKSLPEAVMEDLLGKIMKRGYDISKLVYNRI